MPLMKTIILIVSTMLMYASVQGQQSQALVDFRHLEQQIWSEYVLASRNLPAFTNFDVKFYHLHIDLTLSSPYLQGNVLCRFAVTENNANLTRLSLRREYAIDSIRGMASGYSFVDDTTAISLDRLLQSGLSAGGKKTFRWRERDPIIRSMG